MGTNAVGKLLALCVLVAAAPGLATASTAQAGSASQGPEKLCVMSYNLRYASDRAPNAWPVRRPIMAELINKIRPDVFGTQEGVYKQLKELSSDLPGYEWIGLGRDGGSRGEFMAIFYKKDRFEPLAYDHFWLSDTPEVMGSSTWGNSNKRMVTWVRFQDRQTKAEFYFVNTHFDHEIQLAREKAAQLLRQRLQQLDAKIPILVTGDFNAAASNKAYSILVEDGFLKDTWQLARQRRGEGLGTFNGFKAVPQNNVRIDWILAKGYVDVDATEIVTFSKDGQFPSDHCPLVAWVNLGAGKSE